MSNRDTQESRMRHGRFVVLEGTDGAGSTSQGDRLAERLVTSGYRVLRTAQPSNLPAGVFLRQILRGEAVGVGPATVALLFAADRLDHWERVVEPALARGEIVVCDRHVASSLAFQVVDGPEGLDAEWIALINKRAAVADLTLWFDVPVEVAMARITARGKPLERFEVETTLMQVRGRYAALFADPPAALGPCVRLDASGSIESIGEAVWRALADHGVLDVPLSPERGSLLA